MAPVIPQIIMPTNFVPVTTPVSAPVTALVTASVIMPVIFPGKFVNKLALIIKLVPFVPVVITLKIAPVNKRYRFPQ